MATTYSPLPDSELLAKAEWWVNALILSGGKDWSLRVPADDRHDSDLIFSELIERLAALASIRAALGLPADTPAGELAGAVERLGKMLTIALEYLAEEREMPIIWCPPDAECPEDTGHTPPDQCVKCWRAFLSAEASRA